MNKPIIVIIGTRAEAIKLIPLYLELLKQKLPALLCATFQHSHLLQQACDIFNVIPDFNLNIMKKNQDLFYITNRVMEKTKEIYFRTNPSLVIVQGDTTTTMAAALSAFYLRIPIAHVEAGLRTGNMNAPFPEEMNRKVVGQISSLHFAPTAFSTANLLAEGVNRNKVFCTGNTIVDALNSIREKICKNQINIDEKLKKEIYICKKKKQKIVLLTAHRRESFNGGLARIFESIKFFAQKHRNVSIFFPVHPNPNVQRAVESSKIGNEKNVFLLKPLKYADLVYLLTKSDWVASDSGGIQEEAVSLGKKVLVLRDVTERWEGVWEGTEILVGTDSNLIIENMEKLYETNDKCECSNIYGDGLACKRITSVLKKHINEKKYVDEKKYEENINCRTRIHRAADSPDCCK
jgi:UDP-N-acetylglucosamine 2-epimerase (non-hydrolysing)